MSEKLQHCIYAILSRMPITTGCTRKEIIFSLHNNYLLRVGRTTIYDNLKKLEERNLVYSERCPEGKVGAPKTVWKITEGSEYI